MTDFDELLNEVLHQGGNPEPPFEMQKRILARVSSEAKCSPDGRRVWVGIAAAILVALTTWSLPRIRLAVPVAVPSQVSLTEPDVFPTPIRNRESGLPQAAHNSPRRRPILNATIAIHRRHRLQPDAIWIAPVEIESVAIEPVQIAHFDTTNLSQEW